MEPNYRQLEADLSRRIDRLDEELVGLVYDVLKERGLIGGGKASYTAEDHPSIPSVGKGGPHPAGDAGDRAQGPRGVAGQGARQNRCR